MKKLLLITAIAAALLAGCKKDNKPDDDTFVAVTAITGVTTVAEANKPATLAATVSPPNATNKNIEWTVKNAGTTGASIANGNTLTATAVGTVTVTASIAGGSSKTAPFTADFGIEVKNPVDMPVVTGVTVYPATANVAKGGTQTFTATVTGTNLEETDKTVNWTVTGGTKTGTAIGADGKLTVAADETAANLTVKAASTVDNTKYGTASVTVNTNSGGVITDIAVTPVSKSVAKGTSQQYVANITGTNLTEADKVVTWTVTGGTKPGTAITAGGLLTIDADETATELWVRATAVNRNSSQTNAKVVPYFSGYMYLGTWRDTWDDGWQWQEVSVDGDQISVGVHAATDNPVANIKMMIYTMKGLTWTEVTNPGGDHTDDYPIGYRVTGTYTSVSSQYSVPKEDGSGGGKVGDIGVATLYMSADKQSIRTGNWQTPEQEARYGPYNATWDVLKTSAKFSVTKQQLGADSYRAITVQRRTSNGDWVIAFNVSTSFGTSEVNVVPGLTYRIAINYWSCPNITCQTQSLTGSFTISDGQTRNINIVGGIVTSIQ